MIRVAELVKRYRGAAEPTIKSLSFEVPPGRLAAILGRSGSGKTTLLRCIVGLEPFDHGTIAVDGVHEDGADLRATGRERREAVAAMRRRIGLVFQAFELFPHLTVLENCVLAPMKVKGAGRAPAETRALGLLDQLGLADKARAFPDLLSGGQRQRVAIARALAMEPEVLLYDEPTSALDPAFKAEIVQTLRRVKETGVTQIVVTHDLQIARAAELVFILDHGVFVETGEPGQVLDTPQHDSTRRLLATWN